VRVVAYGDDSYRTRCRDQHKRHFKPRLGDRGHGTVYRSAVFPYLSLSLSL
jgi:hypothetical protein